jgi:hypothetical protein
MIKYNERFDIIVEGKAIEAEAGKVGMGGISIECN